MDYVKIVVTGLNTIPHNVKVELCCFLCTKNITLKCLESISTFRSKHLLNKSRNKLHGLTLCAMIVFNMSFEWLPHLCTPHMQYVRPLRLEVNFKHRFKHRFNHKDQGGFPMPRKEWYLLLDRKYIRLNIPLSMFTMLKGIFSLIYFSQLLITLLMVYQYTQ
jgi:hypothetical protein